MTAVLSDSWRTFDPEFDDLDDKYGASLVKRAKKRRVVQPGPWAGNRFMVLGDPKLGDAYDDYTVTFNGRTYYCTCRDHAYGDHRGLCSHVLAVILYRKGHKAEISGVGASAADSVPPPPSGEAAADVDSLHPSSSSDSTDVEPEVVIPDPRDPMFGKLPLPEWVKEIREHQWPAVLAIVEAFERGDKVVMLDAPTGAGKTLLAELVRRMLKTRALYVCSTKTLQDQFVKDFPYARVLKGRANYPTFDHPEKFGDTDRWGNSALTAADCTKRMMDLPACAACPSDREVTAMHCMNCHPVHKCPYENAKTEALRSDLAVLNTSYFLTEANAVGKFSGDGDETGQGFGLVIVDEADLLENELMGLVEVRITERMQKDLGLSAPEKKTVESAWVEWVEREALPKVTAAMKKLPANSNDVKVIRERQKWERLLGKLKVLEEGLGEGGWVYGGYTEGEIVFRPVRVDRFGREWLWRHGERFLLMSATVISAEEMAESLGLVDE